MTWLAFTQYISAPCWSWIKMADTYIWSIKFHADWNEDCKFVQNSNLLDDTSVLYGDRRRFFVLFRRKTITKLKERNNMLTNRLKLDQQINGKTNYITEIIAVVWSINSRKSLSISTIRFETLAMMLLLNDENWLYFFSVSSRGSRSPMAEYGSNTFSNLTPATVINS